MTPPLNILDLTSEELDRKFQAMGLPAYRAGQVLEWIYGKGVYEFDRMTNLPTALKAKLKDGFVVEIPEVVERQSSHDDKSLKFLLRLPDKDLVETVLIPIKGRGTHGERSRTTVCVSSQVGCKFHCAFCASGQDGFFRNLAMGEIISQVLLARDASPDKKITNIVFMGIGEPFDNYTQLLRSIRTLNSKDALGIGARKITVSTCGIVPKIEALAQEGLQVELSVSLHGAKDAVREAIMPVNRAYPVKSLIEACKKYVKKTRRAITFEYVLIRGINSAETQAHDLARLLKGMLCKVNLIPYNPIEEFPHAQPPYAEVMRFQQILQRAGVKTTVRFSKGRDIQAACGQLRSVVISSEARNPAFEDEISRPPQNFGGLEMTV